MTCPPSHLAARELRGAGIAKIVDDKTGLQNAVSIAGLILTTECLISEIKEPASASPAGGAGGGMGGMY